jgi:hypothetical protein
MKPYYILFLLAVLLTGCATTSSIPKRTAERRAAYDALPPEQQALVDQGHIKVGMSTNAVYLAWGSPSQVINGESAAGPTTTWIYSGTGWQQRGYWSYHHHGYLHGRYGYANSLPTYDFDYIPYRYTSAEVAFENGVVKSWKHVTPPPN